MRSTSEVARHLETIKDSILMDDLQGMLKLLLNLPSDHETVTFEELPNYLMGLQAAPVITFDAKGTAHVEFLEALDTYLWPLVERIM